MSRKKSLRHKNIIDQLALNPTIRVSQLADALKVTTETIRRDLEELAEQQLINRTYGGAMLRQPAEPVLAERHKSNVRERAAIGNASVPLLQNANVIMMGSGATTVQVARRMAVELNNVTVITHSFGVANALAVNSSIDIILTPGSYHAGENAVHGALTQRFLANYAADVAVVGASALSPMGPSDALIDAAEVYAAMLAQSSRSLVVADHSKFDRMATARYSGWSEVDFLVSDQTPQGPLAQALQTGKTQVVVAPLQYPAN
ncbi:DeoR/GlpR family DNA-binding transcription regulator [Oceanobacter mangrovi]|uniref:DeoR/GlpR family DNA-binding transcription regulator n=1 Tax=Oceanobacter mangrovi TaxID=2862510 RepID=UPI001C8D6341|nr:DeoR/GlpR family DNA-binding transcription regulator [Oceanobacter mangrovi]